MPARMIIAFDDRLPRPKFTKDFIESLLTAMGKSMNKNTYMDMDMNNAMRFKSWTDLIAAMDRVRPGIMLNITRVHGESIQAAIAWNKLRFVEQAAVSSQLKRRGPPEAISHKPEALSHIPRLMHTHTQVLLNCTVDQINRMPNAAASTAAATSAQVPPVSDINSADLMDILNDFQPTPSMENVFISKLTECTARTACNTN